MIELLLSTAEAIRAGPGSRGCRVPKVIARKLHQNSPISVSVVICHSMSPSLEHSANFFVRKSNDDWVIKLSLHFGRSCPRDTMTGHTT